MHSNRLTRHRGLLHVALSPFVSSQVQLSWPAVVVHRLEVLQAYLALSQIIVRNPWPPASSIVSATSSLSQPFFTLKVYRLWS